MFYSIQQHLKRTKINIFQGMMENNTNITQKKKKKRESKLTLNLKRKIIISFKNQHFNS